MRKTTSKMAVFDLDNTLFDLSRRERVARRQGLKPKSKKWFEFLNQNQYVLMDTPIPGTTNFVRNLSENGYTIAYLSGRPRSVLAATKKGLQQAGFPIDALHEDLIFLHTGNPSKQNLIKHKLNVLTHLKSKFDVDFFFDDTPEFREAAKSLFIPGVYQSISAYTGNDNPRSNPMMSSFSSTHAYEQPSRQNPHALVCPEHGIRASEEIGQNQFGSLICLECGADLKMDGNVKANPPPKPRKKRGKSGKMRKEPVKKYVERFMGDKKMNEEFPDRAQRFAVSLSYAREFYGNSTVEKHYPPRSNPSHKEKLAVFDIDDTLFDTAQREANAEAAGLVIYTQRAPGEPRTSIKPKGREAFINFFNSPEQFRQDTVIPGAKKYVNSLVKDGYTIAYLSGRAAWTMKETIDHLEETGFPVFEQDGQPLVYLKPSPQPTADYKYKVMQDLQQDFQIDYFFDDLLKNQEKATQLGVKEVHHLPDYLTAQKMTVRTNPGTVTEAKEMYKKFHQKNPTSVEKQKIDIGDTWVGLGKAWSIGYRSPKETGDNKQKYVHHFGKDEESGKKFKEPDLYYVKNKDGSQMMVIMGGDWYIDVDSDGKVSWIYI